MNKKKSHYIETILFDEKKKSRKIVELNAITIALKEVKGSKFVNAIAVYIHLDSWQTIN